ncbi:MAG: hypothetical protein US62_C0006G0025 [Candidatus Woesebacteria bacterium GW2011_GWA1_37_8]|uniref:Methyltransferase type 11 domain-containing protein n=1 Tax=Candidatus Woesebacteria bacterium GW2011_GWA1_37_8 TaxID=1618546 RepID=A0A0G0KA48_9BACT|nr:MAG: hypothetical protein US39_C0004G0049 [Microgenomates group bacterium GW2011_GWC1_37_12b]KKQ46014.1 MAG: hypothetical protein US62_C0006G0025 [Candidatus Woesebacteria bacterium GW2011_GWA1_37_8]
MKKNVNKVLKSLVSDITKIKNDADRKMSMDSLINPYFDHRNRFRSDLNIIKKYFHKGKILEVGSSPYHLTYCLKQRGYDITGVDINTKVLHEFQKKHALKVVQADVEKDKLPFTDDTFDLVICNEVFEHLRIDPLKALREIHRVLKPSGLLILSTPNLYALHKIIQFNLGGSFNNAYFELNKVNVYGYMGHIREYSTKELQEILTKCGFRIQTVLYRTYNNFVDHPFLTKSLFKIPALILDMLIFAIPRFRPFQVLISTK